MHRGAWSPGAPLRRRMPDRPEWRECAVRRPDVLVVGAGFSGAVAAERLASHGLSVLVVDRRPHIGGNAYDTHDSHGVLIHPYGPHIFHTNGAYIAQYLSRFTDWRPYEHRVLAKAGDKLVPIPINIDTINAVVHDAALKRTGRVAYIDTYRPFAPEGDFRPSLPDDSGNEVIVRAPDGVHFAPAGGDIVARMVLHALNQQFDLTSWRKKRPSS